MENETDERIAVNEEFLREVINMVEERDNVELSEKTQAKLRVYKGLINES